jgi:adenosine 3'-phospho 5'-phosphosulfate transporter B3
MMFGVIVSKKRYGPTDYCIVGIMVTGLAMFFHADANTSAVFNPLGIIMLTISLLCDGAISNMSEALMNQYEVGQDEYIFRLYSIATCFICIAAGVKGDLRDGLAYLTRPGTLREIEEGLEPTWSVFGKVCTIALLALTGFLGSSCSAAITKSFGALTSSITSTARKAATIFLSFALFPNNKCTLEHVGGIFFFIASLVVKSLRHSKRGKGGSHHRRHVQQALNKEDNYHSATTDASNENAPLICSSPAYLRRNVGDDFV